MRDKASAVFLLGNSGVISCLVDENVDGDSGDNQLFVVLERFAAAPHEVRTDWAKFTKDYFLNRPTLVSVFLLIDASIPAKKIDLEYASWLGQNEVSSIQLIFL